MRMTQNQYLSSKSAFVVPMLETKRLLLRAQTLYDFPAHAEIWADPRTRIYFEHTPFNEEDCWLRYVRSAGQWALLGYGFWAVQHKERNKYIGSVGLLNAKRTINLPIRNLPEAAWVIAPDFCRQGLGNEALRTALEWADRTTQGNSWCMIDPPNVPSKALAGSVGYRPHSTVEYKGRPMEIFLRQTGSATIHETT